MLLQRTIKTSVHAIGIGVHSGANVAMTLRPAAANTGIVFVRMDLPGHPTVRAQANQVSDTCLSTSIAEGRAEVATVEHLMSALWGLGIDNLIIELTSREVPIMDGSAQPYVQLIESVGLKTLDAPKMFMRITRPVEVRHGDAMVALTPYNGFRASYTFVADHPVYNRYPKRLDMVFNSDSYIRDVCGARSFGLINELEQAQQIDRCLGSNLDNAVGIDDHDIMNEGGLRYEDEFVKHKVLDAIGDLYLLGHQIIGAFEGYKSGHAINNALAKALLEDSDAWEMVTVPTSPADGALIAQPMVLSNTAS